MKVDKVIKKYRKKMNLTQEQIANYLNVSAPAVNKWENGISYPDIELLAPLARILKIDINMLLSFNVELTKEEIKNFLDDIGKIVSKKGLDKAFKRASELIKEYPNCDNLIVRVAESMNVYNKFYKDENYEQYNKKVISWYEIIASSSNENISQIGKCDLVVKYIESEQYEKAQKMLDTTSKDDMLDLSCGKKLLQAQIFEKTKREKSAYQLYEGMILESANEIMFALSFIINQLCNENKYDMAEKYIDVLQKTVMLYDLDKLSSLQSEMIISLDKKDKENTIKGLEKIISEIENSPSDNENDKPQLYAFRKYKSRFDVKKYKRILKDTINNNSDYDFIRDDLRIKKLLKKLEI